MAASPEPSLCYSVASPSLAPCFSCQAPVTTSGPLGSSAYGPHLCTFHLITSAQFLWLQVSVSQDNSSKVPHTPWLKQQKFYFLFCRLEVQNQAISRAVLTPKALREGPPLTLPTSGGPQPPYL